MRVLAATQMGVVTKNTKLAMGMFQSPGTHARRVTYTITAAIAPFQAPQIMMDLLFFLIFFLLSLSSKSVDPIGNLNK